MGETRKRLLVLDEVGFLSQEFLEQLPRRDIICRVENIEALRDRLAREEFQAVLIAMAGPPYAALAIALHIRDRYPHVALMLLGNLEEGFLQKASFGGIEAIGRAADARALCARIAERWGAADTLRTQGVGASVVRA